MRINRKGVTRIVFEFSNVVVKVPKPRIWNHFLRGILSNITEHRTYKWNAGKYDEGRGHLLCPVLWCSWGGWLLIMRKAKVLTRDEWDMVGIDLHKQHFPGDDTMSNYGWLDGKLVKIDYGGMDFCTPVLPPLTQSEKMKLLIGVNDK